MLSLFPEDIEIALESGLLPPAAGADAPVYPVRDRDVHRLRKTAPETLKDETALACTAVAVYHESRGEPLQGQKAVASVVLQRSLVPGRFGAHPCDVIHENAFPFMDGLHAFPPISDTRAWQRAIAVAGHVLRIGPLPELNGADHYHTLAVTPSWRTTMPAVAQIGFHVFYRDPLSDRAMSHHLSTQGQEGHR